MATLALLVWIEEGISRPISHKGGDEKIMIADLLQIPLTTSFCIHFSTFPILNVAVNGKRNSAGDRRSKKVRAASDWSRRSQKPELLSSHVQAVWPVRQS